jgi:hypothetical protein
VLEQVKRRLGVYYSETEKDAEIQQMIDAALDYFGGAGWSVNGENPGPLAVEAVSLFCKMAQGTDPAQMANHPVLTSFIAQARAKAAEA